MWISGTIYRSIVVIFNVNKSKGMIMKRLVISAIGCLGLLVSQLSFAEVKIVIPDSINLLTVNSLKPHTEGGGFFGDKTLVLPDGENQIVFKFQPSVDENDTVRKAYSDVIVAKFTATDTQLTFELPTYRDLNQARQEIKTFEWSLVDADKQPIDIKQDKLDADGVQFGRNFIQDVTDYNQRGGIAAISVGTTVTLKSLPKAGSGASSENTAQLQMWYLKASPSERKEFQKWLIDQN